MKRMLMLSWLTALVVAAGCSESRRTPDGDGDVDADGDGDGDADGDGDGDLDCGDVREPLDTDPQPIVNGSDTWDPEVVNLTDGQALSVGALLSNAGGGGFSNVCTATLVAPELVLTAAHCVTDFWTGRVEQPGAFRFAVGEDAARPLHTFRVAEVGRHPDYSPRGGGDARHDVAVLVLEEDALDALPELRPIPMNCTPIDSAAFIGSNVQNVGYGLTEPFMGWPPPPDNTIRYWTIEEVVEVSDYDFTVDGHGESSVCNGDSGGPSLWTMPDGVVRVMGTVSWGDPSCVDRDHFARVDDSCDFFDEYLGGCGDVTLEGECDGNTALFCEGGAVIEIDCSLTGQQCGDAGDGRMRCTDGPDPCEGETLEGRCDGDIAIWCEDESIHREDCAAEGRRCAPDAAGNLRCVDDPDACAELGWAGECDGATARWCDGDRILTRRCEDCGQVCGWSEELAGFYCL